MRKGHVARREGGRKFPTCDQIGEKKGKTKKKKKENGRGKKKRQLCVGGEKGKWSEKLYLSLRSTEIQPPVFIGVRGKVHIRDESFSWYDNMGVFAKLQEVGNFPTWVISSLKVI